MLNSKPRFPIQVILHGFAPAKAIELALIFTLTPKDRGFMAKAFRSEHGFELIVEGMAKDDVQAFFRAKTPDLAPNGGNGEITIVEIVGSGLSDHTENEIRHTKLTKSLLFSLADMPGLCVPYPVRRHG